MCLFQVCAFNRTVEKVDHFLANEAKGTKIIGARSLEEMVSKLKKPRRVMLLVKAGAAVDAFIDKLVRAGNTWILRLLLKRHLKFTNCSLNCTMSIASVHSSTYPSVDRVNI